MAPRSRQLALRAAVVFAPLLTLMPLEVAHADQITLAWDANTEASLAGYRVYVGESSRLYQPAIDVGGTTTYTVTGLRAGHVYYFAVTAYDRYGHESDFSAEVSASVGDAIAPAVAITSPTPGAVLAGTVSVTASATDNIAVVAVQFRWDGRALGPELTAAPYVVVTDTLSAANGPHVLSAEARDAAGNRTQSAPVSVTVSNNQTASDLVAAFGFDEGTGTIAGDASGNGTHGTITAAQWTAAGRFGGALRFNGLNSWVTLAASPSLDLTTGMTLEAWVQPRDMQGWRAVIFKEGAAGLAYALYANDEIARPAGQLRIAATGEYGWVPGTTKLPLNSWTHIAATYDGTALRVFVNGVQVSSDPISGSMIVSTEPLRIGGNAVWGEFFDGVIDEVRIYRRALTAQEIQRDMSTPVRVNPDLVAAFNFDEGIGSIAADSSGNGNTGTLAGATWSPVGRFGRALSFNGLTDWVAVADTASLDLRSGMTLSAWVNPRTLSGWRTVILKESTAGLAYALYANDETKVPASQLRIAATGEYAWVPGATVLPLNSWTHVAATYDGAVVRLFVNAVEVSRQPTSGEMTVSAEPLRIGGNAFWGEYFDGLVDEVRIYQRALSAAEIRSDMETPVR